MSESIRGQQEQLHKPVVARDFLKFGPDGNLINRTSQRFSPVLASGVDRVTPGIDLPNSLGVKIIPESQFGSYGLEVNPNGTGTVVVLKHTSDGVVVSFPSEYSTVNFSLGDEVVIVNGTYVADIDQLHRKARSAMSIDTQAFGSSNYIDSTAAISEVISHLRANSMIGIDSDINLWVVANADITTLADAPELPLGTKEMVTRSFDSGPLDYLGDGDGEELKPIYKLRIAAGVDPEGGPRNRMNLSNRDDINYNIKDLPETSTNNKQPSKLSNGFHFEVGQYGRYPIRFGRSDGRPSKRIYPALKDNWKPGTFRVDPGTLVEIVRQMLADGIVSEDLRTVFEGWLKRLESQQDQNSDTK